jgi:hypothetical protein
LARRIPPRDDGFPKGKHDDQVDSTAQFLDWFKMPMVGWGIYEFYRQKAEALAAAERGEEPKPAERQVPDLMDVYRKAREQFDRGRFATDVAVVRQQRGRSEG